MRNEKMAIKLLTISALVLASLLVFMHGRGEAEEVIQGNDYLIATFKNAGGGGDAIYIADTRLGAIGVFVYDVNASALQLRSVRPIEDAFQAR